LKNSGCASPQPLRMRETRESHEAHEASGNRTLPSDIQVDINDRIIGSGLCGQQARDVHWETSREVAQTHPVRRSHFDELHWLRKSAGNDFVAEWRCDGADVHTAALGP
jgi:hypothetical protein